MSRALRWPRLGACPALCLWPEPGRVPAPEVWGGCRPSPRFPCPPIAPALSPAPCSCCVGLKIPAKAEGGELQPRAGTVGPGSRRVLAHGLAGKGLKFPPLRAKGSRISFPQASHPLGTSRRWGAGSLSPGQPHFPASRPPCLTPSPLRAPRARGCGKVGAEEGSRGTQGPGGCVPRRVWHPPRCAHPAGTVTTPVTRCLQHGEGARGGIYGAGRAFQRPLRGRDAGRISLPGPGGWARRGLQAGPAGMATNRAAGGGRC